MDKNKEDLVLRVAKEMKDPTVRELVDKLHKDYEMDSVEAAKTIHSLWKEKSIELSSGSDKNSLATFFFSLDNLWFWVHSALTLLTIPVSLYTYSPPQVYIRYVLGSVFLWYVPGAALMRALYPRDNLDLIARLTLSIVSSFAILVLTGFALNYTPFGLVLEPIVAVLALLTEVLLVVAAVRRYETLGKA